MTIFKHVFAFVVVFICCLIPAKSTAQLFTNSPKLNKQVSVGQRKDNYLQYAAASADGGIITVGYTEGGGFSGDDILMVKIAADGTRIFEKTIGTYGKDRCGAFDEDMFGGLFVVGSSEHRIDKERVLTRLWLKKMTDKGVVTMDTVFSEIMVTAHIDYVKYDGTSLNILGVENDSLKSWILTTEGVILEQYFYKVDCLRRLNVKKCTVLATTEATYIYGFGAWLNSDKKGQAFVIKIDNADGKVVENRAFPDRNVKDIGNIMMTEQGDIVLTGTTNKTDMTDENVFVMKLDKTTLSPDKGGFDKVYNEFRPNNFDEGNHIYQSGQETLTVFGASKSHKQASTTTDFMLFNLSLKTGEMLTPKPIFWGNEQNDHIQTVVKTNNGGLWICGSKDNGNSIVKDLDFYFANIYAPKTPIIQAPAVEKVEEEPILVRTNATKMDTLLAGTKMDIDFKIEVKIENKNFKGYKVKAFSKAINSKVQLPESIDLSNKRWQNLDLKLPISVDADLEHDADMPISLCLFNPQGQCLDTLERMIHVKPTPKPRYVVVNTAFKGEKNDSVYKSEKAVFSITFKNVGNATGKNFALTMLPVSNVLFIERTDYREMEWLVGQTKTFSYQFLPQDLIKEAALELKLSYKDATTPSVFSTYKTPLAKKKAMEQVVFVADKPASPKVQPPLKVVEKSDLPKAQPSVVVAEKPQKTKEEPAKMGQNAPVEPQKTAAAAVNGIAVVVVWRQNFKSEKLTLDVEDYIVEVVATGVHALTDKNFTIIHNGVEKRIDGMKMDEISLDSKPTTPQSYSTYLDFKLKLAPGVNTISVKVKDGEYGNTTPEIKVNYRPFDKGTLYILSVGVPDKTGRLHYTQKDARDFAKIFSDKAGRREVQVVTLTSPDSTTATSIATQINELSKQANRPNDAVILYLSTHGIIGEKSELRLLGSNYTVDNKKFTSIDFKEDIIQPLQKLTCSKYLFIDACKSGSVKEQKDVTESLQSILQANSFFALTSCSGNESSYEDDKWQNGAFTKILKDIVTNPYTCKMLDNRKDAIPDGVLSMAELFPALEKGVQDLVKKDRNEKQTPVFMKPSKTELTPIFDYKRD